MGDPSTGDEFRKNATAAYRRLCVGLPIFVLIAGGLGWLIGGWLGLIIAGGLAVLASLVIGFAATFLWAMSQDGA